jgi:hypothetical protein
LNSINVNQNSTSTEITTPTPQQVKKSPITKKNNTLPKPTIPFTIPKQTEKFTPKEITVAIELQPKAYLLQVEDEKISLIPQSVAIEKGASKEVALKQALNQLFYC